MVQNGSSDNTSILGLADWIIIGLHITITLIVAVLVSVFNKTKDKMLAGRSMGGFVIGLSMISGLCSGISYVGVPSYAVKDGIGIMFLWCGYFVTIPVGALLIIPFFHRLQLTTAYQFFSLRFSEHIRVIASLLFMLRIILYLGVVLYAPSLLLNRFTGIPLWSSIVFIGVVATLWTLKGGMYAVIYTDALQSLAMIVGIIVCILLSLQLIPGGIGGAFSVLAAYNSTINGTQGQSQYTPWKLLFELNPTRTSSPAESIWAFLIGSGFNGLVQTSTDQLAVQRFLTAKNMYECILSYVLMGVFNAIIIFALALEGVLILAYYLTHGNSLTPLQNGNITIEDDALPFFALTVLPSGVAGLLLAAVVGSTMSVFSGGINAAATAWHIDILTYLLKKSTDKADSIKESSSINILTIVFSMFVYLKNNLFVCFLCFCLLFFIFFYFFFTSALHSSLQDFPWALHFWHLKLVG